MKSLGWLGKYATAMVVLFTTSSASFGVEVNGKLGSPSATTTIDGKQLPAPEPEYGGKIEKAALDSKA